MQPTDAVICSLPAGSLTFAKFVGFLCSLKQVMPRRGKNGKDNEMYRNLVQSVQNTVFQVCKF